MKALFASRECRACLPLQLWPIRVPPKLFFDIGDIQLFSSEDSRVPGYIQEASPKESRGGVAPTFGAQHGGGHDAFVFAGGVAKGAFAAGALSILVNPCSGLDLSTRRIVGASSGSLNAAYLAYRAQSGDLESAGDDLAAIWLDDATHKVFDVSFRGAASLAGLSTSRGLRKLLARHIRPSNGHHLVDLRLLVTNMAGNVVASGGEPAMTFEHAFRFDGTAFESEARLDALFTAVCASAAFPGAFVPVLAEIDGATVPCLDGGIVNNAPLRHAIGDVRDVTRVFVISPSPRIQPAASNLRGLALLSHLVDALIQERLFRDLREARSVNRALHRIRRAFSAREHREAALHALGWSERKHIEVIEVRPPALLEGGAFDGLFSRALRERYVEAGEIAARAAIKGLQVGEHRSIDPLWGSDA